MFLQRMFFAFFVCFFCLNGPADAETKGMIEILKKESTLGECKDSYFGLSKKRDFSAAYQCFKNEKNENMVFLMQANGEGTARDIVGAEKYFKICANTDATCATILENIENLKEGKIQKIDFCSSVTATSDMLTCANVEFFKAKQEIVVNIEKYLKQNGALSQEKVNKMLFLWHEYENSYAKAVYSSANGGTMAQVLAPAAKQEIANSFLVILNLMFDVQSSGKVFTAKTKQELDSEDNKLNQTYKEVLRVFGLKQKKEMQDKLGQPSIETMKSIKKAQREWLQFRDGVVSFFELLRKKNDKEMLEHQSNGLRFLLTRDCEQRLRADFIQ